MNNIDSFFRERAADENIDLSFGLRARNGVSGPSVVAAGRIGNFATTLSGENFVTVDLLDRYGSPQREVSLEDEIEKRQKGIWVQVKDLNLSELANWPILAVALRQPFGITVWSQTFTEEDKNAPVIILQGVVTPVQNQNG